MERRHAVIRTGTVAVEDDAALTDAVESALAAAGLEPVGHARVIDLATMRAGAWQATDDVYPASVIKIAVMVEAFRRFAEGSLPADGEVVVSAANQTQTWQGTPFAAGSKATVGALVERAIMHSDNVATNQLFDVLRRERVTATMHALGLPTFLLGRKLSGGEPLIDDPEMVGRNRLTPHEAADMLALIALDRVPGAAAQRDLLGRCLDGDKLAAGIAPGDRFMHKTGETSAHSHDAGILETAGGGRYVVVLYTTPEPKADGSDADHMNPAMARWMKELRARL